MIKISLAISSLFFAGIALADEPAAGEPGAGEPTAPAAPAEAEAAAEPAPAAAPAKPAPGLDDIALARLKAQLKFELLQELKAGSSQGENAPKVWEEKILKTRIAPALKTFELKGYLRTRMDHMRGLDLGTARFSSDTPTGWVGSSRVPPALFHPDGSESVSQLSSANMRWRLEPTLNVSEKVQIHSRIDILDNLVLGSTPNSFPGLTNNPSSPVSVFSASAADPRAGVNSATDGLRVKHVYGDVLTPVGRLRFGRMPSHFGLGLLANAGRDDQSDQGDAADRLLFLTKFKGHVVGAAWDFAGEGPIGGGGGDGAPSLGASEGYQAYDLGQRDDVDQYVLIVAKAHQKAELEQLLAAGKSSTN
jgi:hypothetical protein